jgi:hypothetical protein
MWLLSLCRGFVGLVLLALSVASAYAYCAIKDDVKIAGAAIACIACFCAGLYFLKSALEFELWRANSCPLRIYRETEGDDESAFRSMD